MATLLWHRTVVRDGWHNMGTDLCFWRGCYWLTYTRRSCHISPDGGIVVLRSSDLERWQEVGYIKTVWDNRDPKIIASEDKLYVYFVDNWYEKSGSETRQIVYSCVSTSEDGLHWSSPVRVYDRNYWLWRVRLHEGTFYAVEKGGELLTSPDGAHWSFKSFIPSTDPSSPFCQQPDQKRPDDHRTGPYFNEADVLFRPDGELWCVSRTKREGMHSLFYVSKPPYEQWEVADLGTMIHCPAMCESGGNVYVAGRRVTTAPWIAQHTPAGNTGIFKVARGSVEPAFALPSDGDAAYPGMISQEGGRLLICYYSQHAYTGGVLPVAQAASGYQRAWGEQDGSKPSALVCGPDDIYLALVDLNAPDAPARL